MSKDSSLYWVYLETEADMNQQDLYLPADTPKGSANPQKLYTLMKNKHARQWKRLQVQQVAEIAEYQRSFSVQKGDDISMNQSPSTSTNDCEFISGSDFLAEHSQEIADVLAFLSSLPAENAIVINHKKHKDQEAEKRRQEDSEILAKKYKDGFEQMEESHSHQMAQLQKLQREEMETLPPELWDPVKERTSKSRLSSTSPPVHNGKRRRLEDPSDLKKRKSQDSPKREDSSHRREDSSHRREDSSRRTEDSSRRTEDSSRRTEDSSHKREDSKRRSDIPKRDDSPYKKDNSRRTDDSSRRDESSRRSESSRRDESSRRSESSRRDESSRRSESSRRDESLRRSESSRRDESLRRSDSSRRDESSRKRDDSPRKRDDSSRKRDASPRKGDDSPHKRRSGTSSKSSSSIPEKDIPTRREDKSDKRTDASPRSGNDTSSRKNDTKTKPSSSSSLRNEMTHPPKPPKRPNSTTPNPSMIGIPTNVRPPMIGVGIPTNVRPPMIGVGTSNPTRQPTTHTATTTNNNKNGQSPAFAKKQPEGLFLTKTAQKVNTLMDKGSLLVQNKPNRVIIRGQNGTSTTYGNPKDYDDAINSSYVRPDNPVHKRRVRGVDYLFYKTESGHVVTIGPVSEIQPLIHKFFLSM